MTAPTQPTTTHLVLLGRLDRPRTRLLTLLQTPFIFTSEHIPIYLPIRVIIIINHLIRISSVSLYDAKPLRGFIIHLKHRATAVKSQPDRVHIVIIALSSIRFVVMLDGASLWVILVLAVGFVAPDAMFWGCGACG
jgi:hypothetical protein